MKLIKVDGVAGTEPDGDSGASESDFQFNLLNALPVIALNMFVAGLAGMAYGKYSFYLGGTQSQWHQQ
jgi:hypothetical protein